MITDNMVIRAPLPDGLLGACYPKAFFGGKAVDFLHQFADQRVIKKPDEDMVMIGHNDIAVEPNIAPVSKADIKIEKILGEVIVKKELAPPVDTAAEKISMVGEVYSRQATVEHEYYFQGAGVNSCPTRLVFSVGQDFSPAIFLDIPAWNFYSR
jgi:hypothetical protein